MQGIISWFAGWPPELATMILAALPVSELRGALPVALLIYRLPVWSAAAWSIVGNILPVYFLVVFLERGSTFLCQRSTLAEHFFHWIFEHTRQKLDGRVQQYGLGALVLITATPIPVLGGAWTAVLAAFVFGLPKKQSFWAIVVGSLLAAVVIALLTLGANIVFSPR